MRGVLVGAGALIMVSAVVGALGDPDVRPLRHLVFLATVLVAHDALLMPAAIGVGVLIGRWVPAPARTPVRLAGFVTAALLVVAVPLVLGLGRRPDTPSALPLPYGRNLALLLGLVWTVAGAWALTRHLRDRAARRTRRDADAR